jgi:hypothetical protein
VVLREAPWMVAVGVGTGLLLAANPPLSHPWGSNWPHDFESAHFFWDPTSSYFGWRTPLFPLLLASLGKPMGYAAAAHAIARASAAVLVLAAGTLGRAWSGPWAGALAALCVPLLQCAVESAAWTNMYPLAAATSAAAISLGAACARWPTRPGALGAGLVAGLAWKLNHLGLVTIPIVGGLLLLGLTRPASSLRRISLAILFTAGVGSAHGLDRWVVAHWSVPQEDLTGQVLQRRREELVRIRDSQDTKFSACTDFEPKPLNLDELTNACAMQFLDSNYGTVVAEDCGPKPGLLLLLVPLALLPAGGSRDRWEKMRSSAASALMIFGAAGAVYLGATWTSYSEKYILAFVPLMVAMIPVAGDRLGALLGRLGGQERLGRTIGLAAAASLAITTWPRPTGLHADAPRRDSGWEMVSGQAAGWAEKNVGPMDLLLDCVPLRVDLAMLPKEIPIRTGIGTQEPCSGWIKEPPAAEGKIYMLTRSYPELPHTQPDAINASGWRKLKRYDSTHHLWIRSASPSDALSD